MAPQPLPRRVNLGASTLAEYRWNVTEFAAGYDAAAEHVHPYYLKIQDTILDLLGCGRDMIKPVEDRLGHDRRYAIDSSKIQRELGWRPTRSAWPEARAQTIDWYKSNESWWRPLKQRISQTVA